MPFGKRLRTLPVDRHVALGRLKPAVAASRIGRVFETRETFTVGESEYGAGVLQPRHAHDSLGISMILRGSLRERVGRAEVIGQPLDIVVKPVGVEHANEFGGTGARLLQLRLDSEASAPLFSAAPTVAEWRWHRHSGAISAFVRLLKAHRGGAPRGELELAACDAVASLAPQRSTSSHSPPTWLVAVRDRLDDDDTPSVRALAEQAGVHPVYLARQFRRFYDCSITQYLRRHRVTRVAAHLARTRQTLSRVALNAGYYDQSHMCRAFGQVTGVSPSEFRRLVTR